MELTTIAMFEKEDAKDLIKGVLIVLVVPLATLIGMFMFYLSSLLDGSSSIYAVAGISAFIIAFFTLCAIEVS